ncbi:unnamed protein product [Didymodactylos carnosus]|uniref:COMM domain-containing protein n=1 Tax=Didymodactylos carnosus TaxID=1234261 RepID=A0A813SUP6_9BILA|nr:unnamed protein product [Didymodactylos carnosus]CAF0800157.1 unnamed protein product [Didymodactylos carnosus]CAF3507053.1 unnamed protein product [Didymodactylos carnosus]CAF3585107.1 unnamed protein product [Didymodactylos carnosus]
MCSGYSIDIRTLIFYLQLFISFEDESNDLKASIRALQFILMTSAKYSVDGPSLSNELTQLGLPKEHANGLVKVYDENFEKLTNKLRSSILRLTKLNDIQWDVYDVKAINNVNDVYLPVVTMNINYDDYTVDDDSQQTKSIAFSMHAENFGILLADLQAARDYMKTYST